MAERIDTPEREFLSLTTQEGHHVALNEAEMDHWFASAETLISGAHKALDESPSHLANHFVSRFGLKNSREVLAFLNSAGGKAAKTAMINHLAEIAALKNEQLFQDRETLNMRLRLMAINFMNLGYKHKAHSQLLEHIQEQIDKKLHQYNQALNSTSVSSLTLLGEAYEEEIADATKKLITAVELQEALVATDEKYATYLQAIETTIQTFDISTAEDILEEMRELVAQTNQDIAQYLETGDDLRAHQLMQLNNTRKFVIDTLEDLLAVVQGKQRLYKENEKGSLVETSSYSDADFILVNDKKIIKDYDGNHYVLDTSQELEELSLEEKMQARREYDLLRGKMTPVPKMIKENHALERRSISPYDDETLREEIADLRNQIQQVQSARSTTLNFIATQTANAEHPEAFNPPPAPTPTPSSGTRIKSSPTVHVARYIKTVIEMREHPSLRQLDEATMSVRQNVSPRQFANLAEITKRIIPGRPITPVTMQLLLKWGEQFGIDSNKAFASSLGVYQLDLLEQTKLNVTEAVSKMPEHYRPQEQEPHLTSPQDSTMRPKPLPEKEISESKEPQEPSYTAPRPSPFKIDPGD